VKLAGFRGSFSACVSSHLPPPSFPRYIITALCRVYLVCVTRVFLFRGEGDCWIGLGDDPPRDRTAELRVLGFPRRHLGSVQMTTDTALGVTKRVVEDRGSCLFPLQKKNKEIDGFVCADSSARTDPLCRTFSRSCPAFGMWSLTFSFQDYPTIRFNAHESVEMPFRATYIPTNYRHDFLTTSFQAT
jgi:hypothetical protein